MPQILPVDSSLSLKFLDELCELPINLRGVRDTAALRIHPQDLFERVKRHSDQVS
ncbi:hypothetical protein PGTUg99_011439 [Puccinia graminis f. sp. tritici]|uniref:Uncharacterized protein n=1 Tax=Puccinia graminis f. sp. tritici TaxID=56615 RepID=A0A5B0PNG5_PUCGR|nr:hypothetical protein PGTUg99_011439 [Puccinia graminis f. sp. tritici]